MDVHCFRAALANEWQTKLEVPVSSRGNKPSPLLGKLEVSTHLQFGLHRL